MSLRGFTRMITIATAGFIALLFSPVLLPCLVLIICGMYSLTFYLYLRMAQRDYRYDEDFEYGKKGSLGGSKAFVIPFGVVRVMKVTLAFIQHVSVDFHFAPTVIYGLKQYYSEQNASFCFRDIPFNCVSGCKMDIYSTVKPSSTSIDPSDGTSPVIVFVYGGAWSSGDKKLYFLLAKRLMELGFVVVIPNYPLYPYGKIDQQVDTIRHCLVWTLDNICKYGGNGRNVYVMAHSAGAHIVSTLLVYNALSQVYGDKEKFFNRKTNSSNNILTNDGHVDLTIDSFLQYISRKHLKRPLLDTSKIKGFLGIGGVYDIPSHFDYEAYRGVEEISAMVRNMGGLRKSYLRSPTLLLRDTFITSLNIPMKIGMKLRTYFPKMTLIHGENDTTTPPKTSKEFHRALMQHGVDSSLDLPIACKHSHLILALMKDTEHTNYILNILEHMK